MIANNIYLGIYNTSSQRKHINNTVNYNIRNDKCQTREY